MTQKTQDEVMGKRLLFSIVYKDGSGSTVNRKQGCGLITEATESHVVLQMSDGSEFVLPPGTDFNEGIEGGKYTLKDGTVVDSPDFTVTYTIISPKK